MTVLKEAIGKDLSKISAPVYFNEPMSMTQKPACGLDYNEMLDEAVNCQDPFMRLVLLGVQHLASCVHIERASNKPFNAVLGETFEFKTDQFEFLAEQV